MFFLLQHKEIFIYEEKSLKRIIILVLFYLKKKKNPDDLENSSKRSGNGYKEGRKSVLSRRLWSF